MKKEIFSRIMAVTLTCMLGFQPSMIYAANEDFVSGGEVAAVSDTVVDDVDGLFSDSPNSIPSVQPDGATDFGDGSAEMIVPEEIDNAAGVAAGNSIADAEGIEFGKEYNGAISETNEAGFYKFTLNSSGHIELTSVARIPRVYYGLYDSNGKNIWGYYYSANSSGQSSIVRKADLTKGTYYLGIEQSSGKTGSYSFQISFTDAEESFTESGTGNNNTISEADDISFEKTYKGQIAENDEKDFYRFTINSSGRIALISTAVMSRVCFEIYDDMGGLIKNYYYSASTAGQISVNETLDLTKGTYYFGVRQRGDYTGNYNFKVSFSSADESFIETGTGTNNTLAEAESISINTTYKGQIAENDEKDFYKFSVDAKGEYSLTSSAKVHRLYLRVYDSTGNRLWTKSFSSGSSGIVTVDEKIGLEKGTYYLGVEQNGNYTGNYSFMITPFSVIPSDYTGLHKDGDGVYRYYAKGEFQEDYTGFAIYNEKKFYVVNGVLASDLTRLIMFEDEWYYLSLGEVANYTGTVMYNNSWFYVTNGVLDTDVNGLVPYNDGTFLFIGGYLADDVNGLWMSPEDEWYYLSMGRVLNEYTGVAMYDGEFFYIRNGKLAFDYNGTVKYNGASFKVVNGMLQTK